METKTKIRRINQFVYIHYENAKPNGHLITLMDSFRNKLGMVYQLKNDETGKREYAFRDANGNQICKAETIEELKAELATRKTVMLEQAHRQRIQKRAEKTMAQNNHFGKGKSTVREMEKGVETIVEKTVNKSREVLGTVADFVGGEDREAEMREIRARKQDRSRGISR